MKRAILIGLLATALYGCRSQPPGNDPFFGRTTVPPPPTGAAAVTPRDPYYRSAAAPSRLVPVPDTRTANAGQPAASAAANGGWTGSGSSALAARTEDVRAQSPADPSAPPAGPYGRQAAAAEPSVIRIVEPAGAFTTAAASLAAGQPSAGTPWSGTPVASATASQTPLAERPRVIRTIQPRPRAEIAASSPAAVVAAAAPKAASGQPIDIMDLPPAGTSTQQGPAPSAVVPAGFVASQPAATPPAGEGAVATSGSSYAHDPGYAWLRGKLEHSQIDNRWKLRYIPIDGQTDQFGGSVILTDASLLSGCERGDFVEIHGKLGARDPKDGFAPEYEPAEVRRLGR